MTRPYHRTAPYPVHVPSDRDLEIAFLVDWYTLRELARFYGISHERIRQIAAREGYRWRENPLPKIAKPNYIVKFWERVNVGFPEECWNWKLSKLPNGYAQIRWHGKYVYVHILAYQLEHGYIPNGLWVLHKCDNPICCNPAHLYAGTPQNNAQDRERRNRGGHFRRLSKEQVKMIKDELAQGKSQSKVAREMGINFVTINRIANGKAYKDVDVWDPNANTHTPAILIDGEIPMVVRLMSGND